MVACQHLCVYENFSCVWRKSAASQKNENENKENFALMCVLKIPDALKLAK